jgi:hypothetical protein
MSVSGSKSFVIFYFMFSGAGCCMSLFWIVLVLSLLYLIGCNSSHFLMNDRAPDFFKNIYISDSI